MIITTSARFALNTDCARPTLSTAFSPPLPSLIIVMVCDE